MYLVGYILKPQGIRGEIKVEPVSPDPGRFNALNTIFVQKKTIQAYSIESVRVSDRFVFLKLSGVDTRNDAELLRGAELLIPEEELLELGENEYFVHDLIGCRVVDEYGNAIGELSDIMQNTSNDVYVLTRPDGAELLVPAIREVVCSVDLPNKTITIRIPEGLQD
jgi:16S rRNA processing protein RimM